MRENLRRWGWVLICAGLMGACTSDPEVGDAGPQAGESGQSGGAAGSSAAAGGSAGHGESGSGGASGAGGQGGASGDAGSAGADGSAGEGAGGAGQGGSAGAAGAGTAGTGTAGVGAAGTGVSGAGGASGTGGTGGESGSGGSGGSGGGAGGSGGTETGPSLNGCSSYVVRTADGADRTLSWSASIGSDPERCMKIRVGQSVTFSGSLANHPRAALGGDTPNPLDSQDATVTFPNEGSYGFVCTIHSSMKGAIWVVP